MVGLLDLLANKYFAGREKNCEHILDLINIGLVDRDTVEAMNRLLKILYGDELSVVDVDFLKKRNTDKNK